MTNRRIPGENVSIDIETTGISKDNCQILQIAAIVNNLNDDDEFDDLLKFNIFIDNGFAIKGEPYAISMNGWIFDIISGRAENTNNIPIIKHYDAAEALYKFLIKAGYPPDEKQKNKIRVTVAGKNIAGFDIPFLKTLPKWGTYFITSNRVLDPGLLYYNPETDILPPPLDVCLKRAGFKAVITHDAILDAYDVIKVLRKYYKNQQNKE